MIRWVLKAQPSNVEAWSNFGLILYRLKRCEEALRSLGKALAIKPDHALALCNQGLVLNELGRRDEAIASFDRALAISPDHAEAHYNRGNALRGLAGATGRKPQSSAANWKLMSLPASRSSTHSLSRLLRQPVIAAPMR
ncbi:MAG: tetratricopeptide repeat protein [Xanthobacteraceae bacterium]